MWSQVVQRGSQARAAPTATHAKKVLVVGRMGKEVITRVETKNPLKPVEPKAKRAVFSKSWADMVEEEEQLEKGEPQKVVKTPRPWILVSLVMRFKKRRRQRRRMWLQCFVRIRMREWLVRHLIYRSTRRVAFSTNSLIHLHCKIITLQPLIPINDVLDPSPTQEGPLQRGYMFAMLKRLEREAERSLTLMPAVQELLQKQLMPKIQARPLALKHKRNRENLVVLLVRFFILLAHDKSKHWRRVVDLAVRYKHDDFWLRKQVQTLVTPTHLNDFRLKYWMESVSISGVQLDPAMAVIKCDFEKYFGPSRDQVKKEGVPNRKFSKNSAKDSAPTKSTDKGSKKRLT